jgi:hypothetical protein
MSWLRIDAASFALGITKQSVRRKARKGEIESRGEGVTREFLVVDEQRDNAAHDAQYSSADTGHDENDAWHLDEDEYVFRIRDDRFRVPAHQVQQWVSWYTYEGSGLTQREVCRKTYQEHGRDLTRDYLRRILKVLGIDKNSPPFAPHMLDKYDSEELAKLHFARAQARVETAIRAREPREWKKLARDEMKARREAERKLENLTGLAETVAERLAVRRVESTKHRPSSDLVKSRQISSSGLMLSPHFTDLHVGKLSARGHSSLEAQHDSIMRRAHHLRDLVQGHEIDEVHVAFGGDLVHIDNQQAGTTGGTPQDICGTPADIATAAVQIVEELVAMWAGVGRVTVRMVAGNHDQHSTAFLRAFLLRMFEDWQGVDVVPDTAPLQVWTWGQCLVALEHGDGPKDGDYGAILATQYRQQWGATSYSYVQRGHLHHTHIRDLNGVLVQGSRSPASADAWHEKKGYVTAAPGIDAYLYSREFGKLGGFHA